MTYIGIDPGLSGGIGVISPNGTYAHKMPDTERDILDLVKSIASQGPCTCWLERVGPMPKQGVVSVWTFAGSYWGLRMALLAAEIPFDLVPPAKWQGALGCRTGGDKNVSKTKAQQLFPGIKITHAIADALLIAEYGRRISQ